MQIRLQWHFTWFYTAAYKLNSTSINVHNSMLTKFNVGNNIKLYPVWVLIIVQTISLPFHASRSSIIHVNIAAIINAASRLIRMQHPPHCKFRTHHTKLGMHRDGDIPFYYNILCHFLWNDLTNNILLKMYYIFYKATMQLISLYWLSKLVLLYEPGTVHELFMD